MKPVISHDTRALMGAIGMASNWRIRPFNTSEVIADTDELIAALGYTVMAPAASDPLAPIQVHIDPKVIEEYRARHPEVMTERPPAPPDLRVLAETLARSAFGGDAHRASRSDPRD